MILEEASCGNCAYYMTSARACRRYPPTPLMVGVKQGLATTNQEPAIMPYFPSMLPSGWCGEHEPARQVENDN
jgi:hypothetical protein